MPWVGGAPVVLDVGQAIRSRRPIPMAGFEVSELLDGARLDRNGGEAITGWLGSLLGAEVQRDEDQRGRLGPAGSK